MQPFKYFDAHTLDEAISACKESSKIISGGTDCLGLLKNRVLTVYPEILVNISNIPGLGYIREDEGGLRIGALATLAAIADSPLVKEQYGVLAEAARSVASPQIRNMGTLGGNLCQETRCWYYRCPPATGKSYHCYRKGGRLCYALTGDNRYHAILGGKGCFSASPSDTATALRALEAEIKVKGPSGERAIPVEEFFTVKGNILKSDEILTEVRIPKPLPAAKQTYLKFRLRKALDFAIVSVALVLSVEHEECRQARIVLGAVAPAPVRATKAEELLVGHSLDAALAAEAAELAVAGALPLTMNAYKIEVTKALVKRAILA